VTELLLELDRGAREPLRRQLERRLRECLEEGVLPIGARLPGTRTLAADLGVSRGVVVDAYDALVAQGLLVVADRKAPRVADGAHWPRPDAVARSRADLRYDLNPTAPDLSWFPRRLWLRTAQHVLATLPDPELDYPVDGHGSPVLRAIVADYVRRVRGVAVEASHIVVTQGFLQTVDLFCRLLRACGAGAIAVEDPSIVHQRETARRNGLEVIPVPVDRDGMRVEELAASTARAVIATPAHQFPTGAVMSPARRRALVAWAQAVDGLIIEDDYDAEFRYDRRPIGAVQRLSPEHVAYVGTVSKTLVPAVRLGWVAAPPRWAGALAELKLQADGGSDVLAEQILARMIDTGEYERHIRRLRHRYRRRRDALAGALAAQLPDLPVVGASAGLHVVIELPEDSDDEAVADRARHGGMGVRSLSHYRLRRKPAQPGLVLGYGRLSPASIPDAVGEVRRALGR
jgi:GntR family transcriptional regulator/MocR family aminotransferase